MWCRPSRRWSCTLRISSEQHSHRSRELVGRVGNGTPIASVDHLHGCSLAHHDAQPPPPRRAARSVAAAAIGDGGGLRRRSRRSCRPCGESGADRAGQRPGRAAAPARSRPRRNGVVWWLAPRSPPRRIGSIARSRSCGGDGGDQRGRAGSARSVVWREVWPRGWSPWRPRGLLGDVADALQFLFARLVEAVDTARADARATALWRAPAAPACHPPWRGSAASGPHGRGPLRKAMKRVRAYRASPDRSIDRRIRPRTGRIPRRGPSSRTLDDAGAVRLVADPAPFEAASIRGVSSAVADASLATSAARAPAAVPSAPRGSIAPSRHRPPGSPWHGLTWAGARRRAHASVSSAEAWPACS